MVLAVGADRVAGIIDAPDDRRVGARHFTDKEIGGLHALRGERFEDGVGVGRDRAIIEGNDDFMVFERQRLRILHAADAGEVTRVDDENATGAKRIRIARAWLCGGRGNASDKTKYNYQHATHQETPDLAPTASNGRRPTLWRATLTEDYAL